VTGHPCCGVYPGHHAGCSQASYKASLYVHHQAVAAFEKEATEDGHRWEAHEWTGNDPDHCARCLVEWDDADYTCGPLRCEAAFCTPYGDRRCDRDAGHDGYHVRNDGCGRPEYHWPARPSPAGPDTTRDDEK
jgi:hypothetical protein